MLSVVILSGLPSISRAQQVLRLCPGGKRVGRFAQQVLLDAPSSTNPQVAVGLRDRPADGLVTIEARRPGRATVRFTGVEVDYQTGVPLPPERSVPLGDYPAFDEAFEVEVRDCGTGTRPAVEFMPLANVTADQYLTMCPGDVRTARFTTRAEGIVARSADDNIATARRSDYTVVVTGRNAGQAVVTVTARLQRMNAGANVPLMGEQEFSKKFFVSVQSADDCRKEEARKPPAREPRPGSSALMDVCVGTERSIPLPKKLARLSAPFSDAPSVVAVRKKDADDDEHQPVLYAKGLRPGLTRIGIATDTARITRVSQYFSGKYDIQSRACDLTGMWDGDVKNIRISQTGDRLVIEFADKQTYRGRRDLHGRTFVAEMNRDRIDDPSFAAGLHPRVRRELRGTLRLAGTMSSDEKTIYATLTGPDVVLKNDSIIVKRIIATTRFLMTKR